MNNKFDTKKLVEQARAKSFHDNNIMILDEVMLRHILCRHLKAYVDDFETIDKFKVKKIVSIKNKETQETKEEYFFVLSFRFREMT